VKVHPNVISPQAKAYKGDVMSIKDNLTAELTAAQQVLADAQTKLAAAQDEVNQAQTKVNTLEGQLGSIPAEIEQMAEDVYARIKSWFSTTV